MKSVVAAIILTAAMGGVVVLAGRDVPVVQHEAAETPTTQPTTQPATALNAICPVHGSHEADPEITTTHEGKAYAFCCAHCRTTFNEDPARYTTR